MATDRNRPQLTTLQRITLHCIAPHCTTPEHNTPHDITPHHVATHRNTLQHTATHPKIGPGVIKIIFEFGIIELVDSILLFVARPKLHNSLEEKKEK